MKRLLIPTAAVLLALTLAGCSSGASMEAGSSSLSRGDAAVAPAKGGELKSEADSGRSVITTGSVTITVSRPADAAGRAVSIVEAAGGRVDGRTEQAPVDGDRGSAELTLRIPSTKLTRVLDDLEKLGTVAEVTIASNDVTTTAKDLDARVSALKTSVTRLESLMSSAGSTKDLIDIESALSERQANLESLQAEQRQLSDQIDLSTITLRLSSEPVLRAHVPESFLGGLGAGWNALVAFLSGALVVIGVLLPWLLLGAVIAAAVLLIVRRSRRRGAARAAAGPTISDPVSFLAPPPER
jgi:hypothetical protein